ncbi:MAG TPA: GGDEF domain-containing protein, partial [Pirellulales bacterium]
AKNAAAAEFAATLGDSDLAFGDIFAELSLAAMQKAAGGYLHTRVRQAPQQDDIEGQKSDAADAILQIYPLDGDRGAKVNGDIAQLNAAETNLVIVVRLLKGPDVGEEHASPLRDALDDALHDSLTRLPNRRLFERRLQRAIDRAKRTGYFFAVLFLDLDRFKDINDRFGHLAGDRALVAVARRLIEAVRPQDMVARRDGDEFTILLDDLAHADDARTVAQRILDHLRLPLAASGEFTGEERPAAISASIGIAMPGQGDDELSVEQLMSQADSAMYRAKGSGAGAYTVYQSGAQDGKDRRSAKKPRPK